MLKRLFLSMAMLIGVANFQFTTLNFQFGVAFAQSMSDDQVIQFVQKEQAAGSSQQDIVQKLLKKGVTVDQLRRLKKKVEAQQSQMGAVDLSTAGARVDQGASRQRTNKEKALEKMQQQNGFMIRSQYANQGKTRDEQLAEMNEEIAFMDIDSLIYYQNYFRDEN
ncbi:MAG: hypothetical protein II505_03100, partial [Bacteroidaceae bacterium]|nr:hypothetical protein [Bacteroidaceae bacterium]